METYEFIMNDEEKEFVERMNRNRLDSYAIGMRKYRRSKEIDASLDNDKNLFQRLKHAREERFLECLKFIETIGDKNDNYR